MRRHARLLLLSILLAGLALGAAACGGGGGGGAAAGSTGGCQGIHFAKTKFALHAGLAFGAFHRYLLKPYRAGAFRRGAPGRAKALVKAGLAAAFVVHEVRIANRDAQCSRVLRPLVAPLDRIGTGVGALATGFRSGRVDPASLAGTSGQIDEFGRSAGRAGVPVHDVNGPVPGI